ncbi:MAG: ATP-binding protein [Bacteroidota bacterium]
MNATRISSSTLIRSNAKDLERELAWLSLVIDTRLKLFFGQECNYSSVLELSPPNLDNSDSPYSRLVLHYKMSMAERLMLILGLAPHIRPKVLDVFFSRNSSLDRIFTEFGGELVRDEKEFIPTGETLSFLLSGNDLEFRIGLQTLFEPEHFFTQHHIFDFGWRPAGYPILKAPLRLKDEYSTYLTSGNKYYTRFSLEFPARRLETELGWRDIVLNSKTLTMVQEVDNWIKHGYALQHDWGMASKLRPGYRALFFGAPGTGKTLTTKLLGKSSGHDIYEISLPMLVSLNLKEAEKKLGLIFEQAEYKQWILYFDDADVLFGKKEHPTNRLGTSASQVFAYILHMIDNFQGLAILAADFTETFDKVLSRNFESMIYFPIPGPNERFKLWEQNLPKSAQLDKDVNLRLIAKEYELSGGEILSTIRFVSLRALERGHNMIRQNDLLVGIRKELAKAGRRA